uniref:Uncharacterized protein n=1 Tax=Opuntia streptacantha TaxID=393608 RepID=A0A7C9F2W1_OPUST
MMAVLPFICSYHNGRIFRGPFHPFLYRAFGVCTPIIAPGKWTVFNSLLTIFPPSIAVFKMINFTLRHKSKPGLPYPLLNLLLLLSRNLGCRSRTDARFVRRILGRAGRY